MKKSLLSLFAVGISLQSIPAALAEEKIGIVTLKDTPTVDFSSLKPKSAMPVLKSLPTSFATSSVSNSLKIGVNVPIVRKSPISNIVGLSDYFRKDIHKNSSCKTSFISLEKILIIKFFEILITSNCAYSYPPKTKP